MIRRQFLPKLVHLTLRDDHLDVLATLFLLSAFLLFQPVTGQQELTSTVQPSDKSVEALKTFQYPDEQTADVFASDPLLGNPSSLTIDEQGRIFVSETYRVRNGNFLSNALSRHCLRNHAALPNRWRSR